MSIGSLRKAQGLVPQRQFELPSLTGRSESESLINRRFHWASFTCEEVFALDKASEARCW